MHIDQQVIISDALSWLAGILLWIARINDWTTYVLPSSVALWTRKASNLDTSTLSFAAFYLFFWAVRINGCVRRGRQPLLRGPEGFFNVHVRPDFFVGAGKKILRRYWMRMFLPFAVDIPFAIAIFLSGRLQSLTWLILGLAALIHINHSYSACFHPSSCITTSTTQGDTMCRGIPNRAPSLRYSFLNSRFYQLSPSQCGTISP
jgi:hypothetical protein